MANVETVQECSFERNLFIQEVKSRGWDVEQKSDGAVHITVQKPNYLDLKAVIYYLKIYMDEDDCSEMEKNIEKNLSMNVGINNIQFVIYFEFEP